MMMANRGTKCLFLSGAGGMSNVGAEAILLAVIRLYQQRIPDVRFILAAWNPDRVRALLRNIPGHYDIIRQTVPFDAPAHLKGCHSYVICGDVALTESVIKCLPSFWAFKSLLARLFGNHIAFLGIEVEALRLWYNRLSVRWILDHLPGHYVVRNDESLRNLAKLGASPDTLLLGCDPALLLDDEDLRPFPAPAWEGENDALRVGFGIRDFFFEPLRLNLRHLKLARRGVRPGELSPGMKKIVAYLAQLADYLIEQHGARIVFIPHHALHGKEQVILSDLEVAERVRASMRNPSRTTLLEENLHPLSMMNVYRRLHLVVSMRHHANTFAYRFAVPTVGLAISDKINAHFRQIGQEQLLVDPLDADGRKGERVVEGALRDRREISQHLRATLSRAQASMHRAMDELVKGP